MPYTNNGLAPNDLRLEKTVIKCTSLPYGALLFADAVAKNLRGNQPFSAMLNDHPNRLGMAIIYTYDNIVSPKGADAYPGSIYDLCLHYRGDVLDHAPYIFQVIDILCANDATLATWTRKYCAESTGEAWRIDRLPPVFMPLSPFDDNIASKYPPNVVAAVEWWTRYLRINFAFYGKTIPEKTLRKYRNKLGESITNLFDRGSRSTTMGINDTHTFGSLVTAARQMRKTDEDIILRQFCQNFKTAPAIMDVYDSYITVSYGDKRISCPIPPVTIWQETK